MIQMSYVKFEAPKELVDNALEALEIARDSGKVRKGTNEVTKAIERGTAKLVLVGSDVEPPEIVMHLPMLCEEKDIAYIFVVKAEIGESVGIHVPTAAACIVEEGKAKDLIEEVKKKLADVKKK
ncbi:MAG: 50S ribosomal protein L7Ae [Candidatus Altiarchaeota archaeon]